MIKKIGVLTSGGDSPGMKSADIFFEDLRKACPHSHLEKCAFDQEAGLIGAAVYGFQQTK